MSQTLVQLIANNSVVEADIANDAVTRDKINVVSTSSAPGIEIKGDDGSQEGYLQLNCRVNSHGVKIQSPAHSASQSYKIILPDNQIAANKFLKVKSITGSGSTAVGQLEFADAGGVTSSGTNTFAGTNAGDAITSGSNNTAFGKDALTELTSGYANVAIGAATGDAATTAWGLTLVGQGAGGAITTGQDNTCIGYVCGAALTTGTQNCLVGVSAGDSLTTGTNSNAFGFQALETGTTASECNAFGYHALKLATGSTNAGFGHLAGKNISSGRQNTCIGSHAPGFDITTGDDNICIGNDAGRSNSPSGSITTGDNNICLGNNTIQNLFCADTSISSSDSRDKTDVSNFTIGLDWIKALRPVTYRWDRRTWYGTEEEPFGTPDGSKKRARLHVGFLAQEALEVEKANGYGTNNDNSLVVNLTEDGMSYGMKYERLVPILVNAIKELSAKVTALEAG
jgi:hypothetical protein